MTRTLTFAALTLAFAVPPAFGQATGNSSGTPGTRPGTSGADAGARSGASGRPGAFAPSGAPSPTAGATSGAAASTGGKMAVSDSLFAAAAANSGLAEVSISDIGLRRATDPQLKSFSQKMIDDHTRMNAELTALAAQKQIPLPRTLSANSQFCAQNLSGLSGEDFDRCYAKAQLVAHMEALSTFEAEAERGLDPQVKALAAKAVPHIKEHLKMIRPIAMRFEKEKESDKDKDQHEAR